MPFMAKNSYTTTRKQLIVIRWHKIKDFWSTNSPGKLSALLTLPPSLKEQKQLLFRIDEKQLH